MDYGSLKFCRPDYLEKVCFDISNMLLYFMSPRMLARRVVVHFQLLIQLLELLNAFVRILVMDQGNEVMWLSKRLNEI